MSGLGTTEDITYKDSEGVLTKLLVDKGYLDASPWLDKRPEYLLEVKSTTGPCEDAFCMSSEVDMLCRSFEWV